VVTRALLLAVLAAVCAAAGIVEVAGVRARHGAASRARSRTGGRASAALARLGRRTGVPAPPSDLALRLDAAGAPPIVTVAEVMVLKCGAAVTAFAAALPAAALLPGRLEPVATAIAPAGAFVAPDAWLARATRRRRDAMAAELPEVLDLLHVAVAAGLPALRALGEVGRRRGGPLAAELRAAAVRASLGVPHAQALERLARRCPLSDVAALVAAIGRSERHGAALAPALHALAADARAQRAQRVRDRAARAAPKIQLVVALLLVPAVMLLVGACLSAAVLTR
jgi:tight adherence protein C